MMQSFLGTQLTTTTRAIISKARTSNISSRIQLRCKSTLILGQGNRLLVTGLCPRGALISAQPAYLMKPPTLFRIFIQPRI
jgi:hypothetical protein